MKRFSIVLLACGLVSAVALFDLPEVQAEDAKCGEKGQPSCPLQGWMEKHMQEPFDSKDLKVLAASLETAAGFAPDPKWNDGATGWAKIAKDGAAAAKAGNFDAVQQSCKSCHKAWRNQYKKEHRMKPVKA
jgi:cytochrome c556